MTQRPEENNNSAEPSDDAGSPGPGVFPAPVGYGNPPRRNQFKNGQVANPNGRRGKSRNIKTVVNWQLDQEVQIHQGRKKSTLTKREALVVMMFERALKGDHSANSILLKLLRELGLLKDEPDTTLEQITTDDDEIIADFRRRVQADAGCATDDMARKSKPKPDQEGK